MMSICSDGSHSQATPLVLCSDLGSQRKEKFAGSLTLQPTHASCSADLLTDAKMEDDEVQIVSVSRPRRKRKREVTDDVELLFVETLPQVQSPLSNIPQVAAGLDDSPVVIVGTEIAECVQSKKSKDGVGERSKKEDIVVVSPQKRKREEREVPAYWTQCEKCGSYKRRYHLVDVPVNSHEWLNVCVPFLNAGFCVRSLCRIQNKSLWHRLQCERQLMQQTHVAGFDLNERLLYHTSRASTEVICAEGLDQRLGAMGNFGRGIYFSDNPRKCDAYWRQNCSGTDSRKMFACRVLLGDIKVYPAGTHDRSLVREPPKSDSGSNQDHSTYDSVLGNICLNEFVVYNTYRVMPEYVIEYQVTPSTPQISVVAPGNPHSARPSLPMCHVCGDLTTVCRCHISN